MAKSICVITATGKQGQATAIQLLNRGYKVSTLARNISSKGAKKLQDLGAVVHEGSLDSKHALRAAMKGSDGLFLALPVGYLTEIEYAKNVLDVAREIGVSQAVHSSVARTGDHRNFPGWNDEDPSGWYWRQKETVENMVRAAGFQHWTILRPAFFMQNFCYPECDFLFPGLASSQSVQVALKPDTKMNLIHSIDIGIFAANAFDKPLMYHGKNIPLAGDKLTISEVVEFLQTVLGRKVEIEFLAQQEADTLASQGRADIISQMWQNEVGYDVDIDALKSFGVPLTTFAKMLETAELGW